VKSENQEYLIWIISTQNNSKCFITHQDEVLEFTYNSYILNLYIKIKIDKNTIKNMLLLWHKYITKINK